MLHANDALTVNKTLALGTTNETVSVTAAEAQINLENASSEGLINSEQLNEMPLVTRNYEVLMNLQPGVAFGGSTDDLTRGPARPERFFEHCGFLSQRGPHHLE